MVTAKVGGKIFPFGSYHLGAHTKGKKEMISSNIDLTRNNDKAWYLHVRVEENCINLCVLLLQGLILTFCVSALDFCKGRTSSLPSIRSLRLKKRSKT